MLLDPDAEFRDAVGAGRNLGVTNMLNPKGAAAYVGALRKGFGVQKPTQDAKRSPGVVVLDRGGVVRWRYIGERLGDYPAVDALRTVSA